MPYRLTLMDRFGPDVADLYRAAAWAIPVSLLIGAVVLLQFRHLGFWGLLLALLAMVLTFALVVGGTALVAHGAGAAAQGMMLPSGKTTPSVADYSFEKALEMKGQLAEAIASYQRHLAERPELVAPRLLAADLHVRLGDPAAAHRLLLEARGCAGASEAERLHVANRLIDLYLGALDRPDDARRELIALIREFPGSQAAAHARVALRQLGPASPD